jgi:large subunit ribosomal protein LP0
MPKQSVKDIRKDRVWDTVQECVDEYDKCLFVNVDNVTSKQICIMRKALRAIDAKMVMGKNTLIRKALGDYMANHEGSAKITSCKIIEKEMALNTGLIFVKGDLSEVKEILDSQKREAPARIGSIAPIDVTIPAGPTGLDPKQTSFFQALKIQTKIQKGQVEIVTPVTVIHVDDKITPGQAALLDKLKIRPFEYKMHIKAFMDNGKRFDAKVLAITPESIRESFQENAK